MLDTPKKLALAKCISAVLRRSRRWAGLSDRVRLKRRGIHWDLDLAEGIDLSIYLLGAFEPRLVGAYRKLIRPGACILDIGANIGAHTLQFAKLVGDRGRVVAYEPTAYAFDKLQANLRLNPMLAQRVTAIQAMLVASADQTLAGGVVSSWPLDARARDGRHSLGAVRDTTGAVALTLDESLRRIGISAVDFIKIDVDGNELDVLRGGDSLMRGQRPTLFLELAPYEYRNPGDFEAFLEILWRLDYGLRTGPESAALPRDARELRARIPALGSINVIASPSPARPGSSGGTQAS
ncbi:MAG TPA: FkbM family methyltransferase [Burkholderiales bacterium]|nr:FkbM family methyltransferase [Burkholderiales bacterium]